LAVTGISASGNDGNVPSNVLDGSFSTRWSSYGIGQYITADLGAVQEACGVRIAWYNGNQRTNKFVVSTSTDGSTFKQVYSGVSSGTTTNFESYGFTAGAARYVRVTVNGNSQSNWASITELRVLGLTTPPDAGTAPDAGSGGNDGGSAADAGVPVSTDGGAYDRVILGDQPVGYWAMNHTASGTESDLSGHGNAGAYKGGIPPLASMPNGDQAADFNGSSEYLTIPSNASFSIPTTGTLTWEAWIRPDVLQFPHASNGGYVDYMGKCASYSPTCEWESRMYDQTNPQGRTSRLSAYVFNPTAGLGSGADLQPADSTVIQAGHWYHVVGEYQTLTQPAGCSGPQVGGINIWVDGVEWDKAAHGQTGCMSQYGITPVANNSPLQIGSMALDTWFEGAIGKVAIYDYLLTPAQIASHFSSMTGKTPGGSCGSTCVLTVQ
jgi:hypothetical protein